MAQVVLIDAASKKASDAFIGSLSLVDFVAIVAGVATVLIMLFGDSIVVRLLKWRQRSYGWDAKPLLGSGGRTVEAKLSHTSNGTLHLVEASIVAPQRPVVRVLWRLIHRERLERWVNVVSFLDGRGSVEMKPSEPKKLSTDLPADIPLPTWKLWELKGQIDPAGRRLLMLVRFGSKKKTWVTRVGRERGSFNPLPQPTGGKEDAQPQPAETSRRKSRPAAKRRL